jgi:predicted phage terminase large subunit-like protein
MPPLGEVLKDRSLLQKLTDIQLHQFLQTLKEARRGLGRAPNLPPSPSLFAQRFSRNEWRKARHLDLLSQKITLLKQRKLTRLMVSMPPRSGKSMLIDIFTPAWWLADAPKDRIILAGYGEQFARAWGAKVRDLIIEYGEDLNLLLNKDRTAADDWELTTGGGMVCVGVGGALMGRGADLLIIDDPIKSSEEADSPTYRDKMWEWFQSTAITRLQPGGVVIAVMTRWSTDDLFARIQQNAPPGEWEVINLPAQAEADDVLGRLPNEPLWPEQFPDDPNYEKRKASMSPFWWSALYQGRPVPAGGGLIKEDWLRYYHTLPDGDQWIQSWDFSLKDTTTSDYTVGQVWCRKGASLYLVAQFRGHANLSTITQQMKSFTINYPKALGILIEDTALGPVIKQTLQHEVRGLIPIKPKGSKRSRLEAVQPLFMGNNVLLPEKQDGTKERWVWDFVSELTSFPKGAHDDQVDACSQAVAFLTPGVWTHTKQETDALKTLPVATPADTRKAWMDNFQKTTLDRADRAFKPRGGLLVMRSRSRNRGW